MKWTTISLLIAVICATTVGLTTVLASSYYHTKKGITHGCTDTAGCSDNDPVGDGMRKGKNLRNGHWSGGTYVYGLKKASVGVYLNGSTTTPSNWVVSCTNCDVNKVCVGTGCNNGTAGEIDRECDYYTQHRATNDTGGQINHPMHTRAFNNGIC
jgi:hypothetical protein